MFTRFVKVKLLGHLAGRILIGKTTSHVFKGGGPLRQFRWAEVGVANFVALLHVLTIFLNAILVCSFLLLNRYLSLQCGFIVWSRCIP